MNKRTAIHLLTTGASLLLINLLIVAGTLSAEAQGAGTAYVLTIDDAIGPATRDHVIRTIEQAERDGAELVVIRMNTPGGLDASMRDIIRTILAAKVPVATWVAPAGSRAASAGR